MYKADLCHSIVEVTAMRWMNHINSKSCMAVSRQKLPNLTCPTFIPSLDRTRTSILRQMVSRISSTPRTTFKAQQDPSRTRLSKRLLRRMLRIWWKEIDLEPSQNVEESKSWASRTMWRKFPIQSQFNNKVWSEVFLKITAQTLMTKMKSKMMSEVPLSYLNSRR